MSIGPPPQKGVPKPELCPHCGGTEFVHVRLGQTVGTFGVRSRPAFKCVNTECGLRFDGYEWTYPDGQVFELTQGT